VYNSSPTPDLDALASEVATGNAGAARLFVEAIAPDVLRTVRQVLGTGHRDVEDVTQEALVASLQAMLSFRKECSVRHFVKRIALLYALSSRRKTQQRQRLAPTTSDTDLEALPSPYATPFEQLNVAQRRALFLDMLDSLPPAQAEAISLHCILGLTVAEAAASAGVPVNTLRGQLVSAKSSLRQRLDLDPAAADLMRGAL
jgi:RNA polymerase sigma-70 factor, ECF subfamily